MGNVNVKQTASVYAAKIKTKIHSEKFQLGYITGVVSERKHLNDLIKSKKSETNLNFCDFSDTSSFFKLSLKTNNKALALALVAQKHRSREMETEVVRLRKDVQALTFDLAFQRHKNKQLVSPGRETVTFIVCCG